MLERLIRFALENRLIVAVGTVMLAGLGSWALVHLPVDAFPDTTPIQVQVNTVAPALSPEEIEQQITIPVELSLGGLPGLAEVRSVSQFGFSQVVAVFDDHTAITDARQYVAERLAGVTLPAGIDPPELGPIATGLGEVFHYTMSSTNSARSLEDLRTLHDWLVKPELRKVPGVAEVNSWGGKVRQFHVVVAPERLARYDLALDDVIAALEANNRNVGGGVVTVGGQASLVHGVGRVGTVEDIASIMVASFEGRPVFVRDLGNVEIGHEIRRGAVTAQGRGEAVLGLAFTLMGENPAAVTADLKAALARVMPSLPDDVVIDVVYDRTELTAEVLKTVRHNLIAGAILVIVVLYLLLGNLRAGLIVAVTIPLALLCASLGMTGAAIAASLLSLGAIDFGILVDGSVVMTEVAMRRLAEKRRQLGRALTSDERRATVLRAALAVVRPIAFGMGIILIVFVPILTLQGTEGKMFRPMALTFMFAMGGALLLALLLTPVLGASFLGDRAPVDGGWLGRGLTRGYRPVLEWVLRRRRLVIGGASAVIALAAVLGARLGGEFLPQLKEGAVVVNVVRISGVAIDESVAQNTRLESLLLAEFPDEIRHVWTRIGTAEVATDPMGTELSDVFMTLYPRAHWTRARTQEDLTAQMSALVSQVPGASYAFTQPIVMRLNEMASGIRSDLGVKIFGDDFDVLVDLADQVNDILAGIEGAGDVGVDQVLGQPVLEVAVDRQALARHGIPADAALAGVEAIGGLHVGEVFEGQRQFPLVVRWPDRLRGDPQAVADLLITGGDGARLPLGQLAVVGERQGLATINREWGRRLIRVQVNVAGRDVASYVREARERITREVALPTGYVIDWGGQFQHLERAKVRLGIAVPTALLLVLTLLYLSLKRVRDVAIIATGIPFAFVGAVIALELRGLPFSVSAAVGFVALAGIAVLNGQILVAALRDRLRAGKGLHEAIVEAGCRRLRPVLATAITDAAGFIPMAISTGVGAEVQRPLATVVIGGVISSTVLTLLVLPVLYRAFGGAGPRADADGAPPVGDAP
ncbi:MAG: CusA/CzcA family heavy metal efflux RND transporter [Candidatus Krumholzibacteriia bacterium]